MGDGPSYLFTNGTNYFVYLFSFILLIYLNVYLLIYLFLLTKLHTRLFVGWAQIEIRHSHEEKPGNLTAQIWLSVCLPVI